MQISVRLVSIALLAAAALTACNATGNLTITPPKPSSKPSSGPSAQPSASPSAQGTPEPTTSPQPVVSASASASVDLGGKLTVTGADLFNKYNVDFKSGMKWVYGMRLADLAIPSIPSLPGGVSIPGFPSSGSGSGMDIGELTMEVIEVKGDLITMKTQVITKASPVQVPATTRTIAKKDWARVYVDSINEGAEGTITWTAAGSENVKVAAGSYSADVINGVFDITSIKNGARADLDQTAKIWIASGVGMVKEEVKSKVVGTAAPGTSQTDTTTVIELKSFSR